MSGPDSPPLRLVVTDYLGPSEAPTANGPRRIDPKAPLANSRLIQAEFEIGGLRTMYRVQGEFYRFRESHYRLISDDSVHSMVYKWLERQLDSDGKPVKPNRRMVSDHIDALRGDVYADVAAVPGWLGKCDEPPAHEFLILNNGMLHLPSREFRQHDPRLFSTSALDIDFDYLAPTCTGFLSFLSELFCEDQESIEVLQEFIGYCVLTEETRFQKSLMLVGPKRSGKGTLLRLIADLAGRSNVASPTLGSLGTTFGLQGLIRARVAIVSDARISGRSDISAIAENLLRISGEDAISVPRKHQQDWVGKLPTRFIIATNEIPTMADASAALASRFLIVRLTRSFYGVEDHGLSDRLQKELPGILHWAMEGLDRLMRRGRFVQPASGLQLVEEMESLSSPHSEFITDHCIADPAGETPIQALYEKWCDWCRQHGRDHPGTSGDFGKKLRAALPNITATHPRRNGSRIRCYLGIRLRTAMDIE